jgi:preprotein translocase subunit SecG
MAGSSSGSKGTGAILTVASAVLAVLVGLFVIMAAVASYKTTNVEKRWERTLGTWDEILERYPTTEANAAALKLERLSARLGIDTATRSYEGRPRPTQEQKNAFKKKVAGDMAAYRTALLEQPRRSTTLPPANVAAFLEAHEEELAAVRAHLTGGDVPRWEMHLEYVAAAPIPNLLGHIDLQKLLITDALAKTAAGDRDRALEDLEASWTLMRSLADSPILISQLIAIADARMLTGALRQIDDVPAVWRQRLSEHDFRRSFTNALKFESWFWTQFDDAGGFGGWPGLARWLVNGIGKPYFRFCLADVSDDFHERLLRLDDVRAICDYDLSTWGADLDVPIPRWNAIGGIVVPNLRGSLERLARLELDIELTVKLLELEAARRSSGGDWPESLPGGHVSRACPGDRWVYEATPDGGMTLAFGREISWTDLKGHKLPTRFAAGPG